MKKTYGLFLILVLGFMAFQYVKTSPVEKFLSSLDEEQLEKTQLEFNDHSREVWHFLPGAMWPRKGILLKDLERKQKELFFIMLQDQLSEAGFKKILRIMDLENVLVDLGGDSEFRDAEKYFIAIYGDPLKDALWAWSFEGHHISLNFTIAENKVSMAPRFLGANPAVIPSGKRKGERTLAEEDDMGLQLINSMDSSQRLMAIFSDRSYIEIVTSNSTEVGPLQPVGIKMSSLNEDQKNLLTNLIKEYLATMPEDLAKKRMQQLEEENLDEIRFGWAGATALGQGHYYRIQGKSFLIEFDNTLGEANHIHTVWRDFMGDFGKDIIKEHYLQSSHF